MSAEIEYLKLELQGRDDYIDQFRRLDQPAIPRPPFGENRSAATQVHVSH
jgi:hypothetical protein